MAFQKTDRWLDIDWIETASFTAGQQFDCPYALLRIAREDWGTHFITHHVPPFCIFLFWHGGEGAWIDDDGAEQPLRRGSFLLYGMHTGPVIINTGDVTMPITTVFFETTKANPFAFFEQQPPISGVTRNPNVTEALLRWLMDTSLAGGPWAQRCCSHALSALLETCRNDAVPDAVQSAPYRKYVKCLMHMQRHVERLLDMEQVAEECHVDVSYLCRLFRRFGGTTPYLCLMRLRMKQAAALLRNERLTVREVSNMLGFSDQYAFSKAFKRITGMAPAVYRQTPCSAADLSI